MEGSSLEICDIEDWKSQRSLNSSPFISMESSSQPTLCQSPYEDGPVIFGHQFLLCTWYQHPKIERVELVFQRAKVNWVRAKAMSTTGISRIAGQRADSFRWDCYEAASQMNLKKTRNGKIGRSFTFNHHTYCSTRIASIRTWFAHKKGHARVVSVAASFRLMYSWKRLHG